MSKNLFKDWTPEMVEAHNRKVEGSKVKPKIPAVAYAKPKVPQAKVRMRNTTDEEGMNKTEKELFNKLAARGFVYIGIQNVTLKLADNTRYTPDFMCVGVGGEVVFFEAKGAKFWDDAKVKLKVAARTFPMFRFVLAQKKKGTWEETEVNV